MEQRHPEDDGRLAEIKAAIDEYKQNGNLNVARQAIIDLTGGPIETGRDILPAERVRRSEGMKALAETALRIMASNARVQEKEFIRKHLISNQN